MGCVNFFFVIFNEWLTIARKQWRISSSKALDAPINSSTIAQINRANNLDFHTAALKSKTGEETAASPVWI